MTVNSETIDVRSNTQKLASPIEGSINHIQQSRGADKTKMQFLYGFLMRYFLKPKNTIFFEMTA